MLQLGSNRSAIRELFEQGKILKQKFGNDKVYDFSIGNPSVPAPNIVNDALKKLVNETDSIKLHGYTSAEGDLTVRQSIADYMNKKYNANASANLIYLTTGAAAALTISIKAIVSSESDEAIVFTPYFPEYYVFIKNANAKVVEVEPDLNTFYPDFDDFENKITKNTKIVIINSPNNPTGVFYNADVIKKLVEIVDKKQKEYNSDIYIISDEPYRELLYLDAEYPCINNYYNNSIITYSFSKSLSIPGERVGYILINEKCKDADSLFRAVAGAGRSMGFVCANTLFQYMIPEVLGKTSDFSIYIKNKNYLREKLTAIGYEVINPDGAFYMFVKSPIPDAIEFSKMALKYNLLLVPSDSFGIKGYVRISYCTSFDTVLNSITAFENLKKATENL